MMLWEERAGVSDRGSALALATAGDSVRVKRLLRGNSLAVR